MRSLLIADRDLAVREAVLLHRLVIGLLDAGVHVTLAAPESVIDRIEPSLGVEMLAYRLRGAGWTRGLRARDLLDRFLEATAVSEADPGLVHAFGPSCFPMASDVARLGDLGLVLEAHSRSAVSRAVAIHGTVDRCVILAGSPGLTQACVQQGAPASAVRERSWGVALSPADRRPKRPEEAVSIAVGGPGRDRAAWDRALRGIAQVAGRHEPGAIFVDADGATAAAIGPLIGQLGLSPLVSRVPDFEARRHLVVQADILVWPERLGEIRSVVIDALAAHMAVVALEDPDVPALASPARTALVSGDAEDWAHAIETLVVDPAARSQLGDAAHAYASEHHRATTHVSGVVDAYEWCVGSDALRIEAGE
ncbi:MAG: hypothetical protein ACTS22_06910 [Phycisphaerales bacterium]